jgi:predicted nucleotidyltransferase
VKIVAANIRSYQEAYESALGKLKSNSQVIAIVVYGSMVSGDIWEESDIDFLVITKEKNKIEHIYSKIFNIPLHIFYISKEIFIDSYKNLLKGGTFHKAFFTGKLVYCSDNEIKDIHLSTRFYGDKDRDARNIEILCNLLNSIHYTKKYYSTNKLETAYQWCIEVLTNYARILMSLDGHITDKDILTFAATVNGSVEYLFNVIKDESFIEDKIHEILNTVENFIEYNLESISKLVIEFLNNSQFPVSVEDLKTAENSNRLMVI